MTRLNELQSIQIKVCRIKYYILSQHFLKKQVFSISTSFVTFSVEEDPKKSWKKSIKTRSSFSTLLKGSISTTCLGAAFTRANAVALNFYFTNKTTPNFTSTLN